MDESTGESTSGCFGFCLPVGSADLKFEIGNFKWGWRWKAEKNPHPLRRRQRMGHPAGAKRAGKMPVRSAQGRPALRNANRNPAERQKEPEGPMSGLRWSPSSRDGVWDAQNADFRNWRCRFALVRAGRRYEIQKGAGYSHYVASGGSGRASSRNRAKSVETGAAASWRIMREIWPRW